MARFEYAVRPIERWPGKLTFNREYSRFKADWVRTSDLMGRELEMIDARHVALQMAITELDIKRDGGVRANARPEHPGVILSLDSRFGPLQYACDQYHDWQDNVRAIALSLEALRKVDRYGVSKRGEQYRGWNALEDKKSRDEDPSNNWTRREAAEFIQSWLLHSPITVQEILRNPTLRSVAYREAAKRLHPDHGGDVKKWNLLQKANDLLLKENALVG
jgi:hypothetical protein